MKICQWCNKGETKRKFCSRECFGEFRAERGRRYRAENKEKMKQQSKEYREKNKEEIYKKAKEWKDANKERIKSYGKEYYEKNKDKLAEKWQEYYLKSGDDVRKKKREYTANLPPEKREMRNKWKNNYYHFSERMNELKKTPKWKIRGMMSRVFSRMKMKKPFKTDQILGCSYDDAVAYFESLFQDGMTWENHGTDWHFDHIKPLASVADDDIDALLELNKIENIRPTWSFENLSKGAKYEGVDYRYFKSNQPPSHVIII